MHSSGEKRQWTAAQPRPDANLIKLDCGTGKVGSAFETGNWDRSDRSARNDRKAA